VNEVARIEPARPVQRRLAGTAGALAVVGEVTDIIDGNACWKLHPAYAAWFWPLMLKATAVALLVPETLLEPVVEADLVAAPRAPTEEEKDHILKQPEPSKDAVRVYTLVLKGKQPSVHKAFPTRMISLGALRYCRARISADPAPPALPEPVARSSKG
jgi:hypothetical protein